LFLYNSKNSLVFGKNYIKIGNIIAIRSAWRAKYKSNQYPIYQVILRMFFFYLKKWFGHDILRKPTWIATKTRESQNSAKKKRGSRESFAIHPRIIRHGRHFLQWVLLQYDLGLKSCIVLSVQRLQLVYYAKRVEFVELPLAELAEVQQNIFVSKETLFIFVLR
jgi:hypothetical protein